jgi:chromosome partitioning protein
LVKASAITWALEWVLVTSTFVVALQPSLIDLKTLNATLDIIRLAGNKPMRALLTRVRAAGTRHDDTTAWLTGPPTA